MQGDYLEVFYESLVTHSEAVMREVSAFIGCAYDPEMIALGRSPEDRGSTRGQYGIVAHNTQKYLTQFSPRHLQRIEQIVCEVAEPRYRCTHAQTAIPLNRWQLFYYKFYDGMASLTYHMSKENSMVREGKRLIRHYIQSGWRCLESSMSRQRLRPILIAFPAEGHPNATATRMMVNALNRLFRRLPELRAVLGTPKDAS